MYRDYDKTKAVDFSVLKGKTLKSVENKGEEIIFTTTEGETFRQIYYEDCCASCSVEDICGDLNDLVGSPILMAEESSSTDPDELVLSARHAEYEKQKSDYEKGGRKFYYDSYEEWCGSRYESETWTFYKAATIKGSVTIRWYGSSNGYYSESATFEQIIG